MTSEVLIDGYNLLMARFPRAVRVGPNGLERARTLLLDWLRSHLPEGTIATVVFDARDRGGGKSEPQRTRYGGIEVVFATGLRSADELIFKLCRQHASPRNLTVVSNDREIQRGGKRSRVHVMSCDQFEADLFKPPPEAATARPARPEKPNAPTADEVALYAAAFRTIDATEKSESDRGRVERSSSPNIGPGAAPTIADPKPKLSDLELGLEDFLAAMLAGIDEIEANPTVPGSGSRKKR